LRSWLSMIEDGADVIAPRGVFPFSFVSMYVGVIFRNKPLGRWRKSR